MNARCITYIATGLQRPCAIAVKSGVVYWTDLEAGTVSSSTTVGHARSLLASGISSPRALAVDDDSVYWTAGGGDNDGTVMKVPRAGGAPITLASAQPFPFSLAVDATNVYWTDQVSGSVMKLARGGGSPTMIAAGQKHPVAVAVDAGWVYWLASRSVFKVPVTGGTPTALFSAPPLFRFGDDSFGLDGQYGFALQRGRLFWTNDRAINSVSTSGGSATWLSVGRQGCTGERCLHEVPQALVADSDSLYWTSLETSNIRYLAIMEPFAVELDKSPLDGGNAEAMEVESGGAYSHASGGMAVDADSIYWADSTAGAIVRVTPK